MPRNNNVDERVVEMRIDHGQFESGAKQTISTLEKLEKALKLKGDSSGIENMERAVGKFDTSPMTSALSKVEAHFSALEVAGLRVIQNLTDSIYNFATKTVKSLTIDQVTEGFSKYEKMIEATQTIMAATRDMIGTGGIQDGVTYVLDEYGAYRDLTGAVVGFIDEAGQMNTINNLLDKLLWYTDETSYNFTDMADNVGKFLSAGVGLEDAFTAMMGIASWGASAGAKPAEVSRAMYNISQAMGSGAMQVVDWRSIENANMATLDFKRNVLMIAKEMGYLNEVTNDVEEGFTTITDPSRFDDSGYILGMTEKEADSIITAMNFREDLKEKWFNEDIMTEVFRRYGLFADHLHQATEDTDMEATEILEVLDKVRETDGAFDWEAYGKSAKLTADEIEALKNAVEDLDSLQIDYGYSEQGFRLGQEAKTFTDALEATKDAVSSGWMKTFKYIFGDYLQAKSFWTDVTGELWTIFASGGNRRNDILKAWAQADENGLTGRDYLLARNEEFQGVLWNLLDAVRSVTGPIGEAFDEVFGLDDVKTFGERLRDLTRRLQEFTAELGFTEEAQEGLKRVFTGVFTVLKDGIKVTGKVIQIFTKLVSTAGNVVDSFMAFLNGDMNFEQLIESLKANFSGLGDYLKETGKNMIKALIPTEDQIIGLYDRLKGVYTDIKKYFANTDFLKLLSDNTSKWFNDIKNVITVIEDYLETHFPNIMAGFREWKENHSLLGSLLDSLVGGYEKLSAWFAGFKIDISGLNDVFQSVSGAVTTLFCTLFGNPEELKAKIIILFDTVKATLKDQFSKLSFGDVLASFKTAGIMVILVEISQILNGLKRTIQDFSSVREAFNKVLGSAGKMFEDIGMSFRANAILKIAMAVGVLTLSLWGLTKLDPDKLTHSAVVIGLLLGVITLLAKSLGGLNKIGGGGVGNFSKNKITVFSSVGSILIALGGVIAAIAGLILVARNVEFGRLKEILIGVGALMAEMALISFLMSKVHFTDSKGVVGSFLAMSIALDLLIPIIAVISRIPVDRYTETMLGVGGLLAAFGIAAGILSSKKLNLDGKNLLKIAEGMAVMSIAFDLLIPIIRTFTKLNGDDFAKGFGGLLAVMVMLGALAGILGKLKIDGKNLLAVAGSMALMAVAIDLMIPAVTAFAGLISGVVASINWTGLAKKLGSFGEAFLKVLGALALAAVAAGVVYLFGKGIFYLGAGFAIAAVGAGVLALALGPLGEAIPKFVESLQQINKVSLGNMLWNFGKVALAFLAFAAGIAAIVVAVGALKKHGGLSILTGLGTKLATGLATLGKQFSENIIKMLPMLLDLIGAMLVLVGLHLMNAIPGIVEWCVSAVITLFNSLADSVEAHKNELVDSITRIILTVLDVISSVIEDIFSHWDDMSLLQKTLLALGSFEVGNSLLHLTDHLKGLFNVITGGGVKGGGGGLAGALGGSGGSKGLIGLLKELSGAGAGTQAALDGMYMGASSTALGAGVATAGIAGLLAALGLVPTIMLDNKLSAEYTANALNDLGTSTEDVTAKAVELANTWREGEAALYDYTGASTVSYQEGRYAANALAEMLGVSTAALEAQMSAAHGNIMETQAMIDYLNKQTEAEAESARQREESVRQMGEATARLNQSAGESHAEAEQQAQQASAALDGVKTKADETSGAITSTFDSGTIGLDALKVKADEFGVSWDVITEKLKDFGFNLDNLNEIKLTDLSSALSSESGQIPAGVADGITSNTGLVSDAINGMSAEAVTSFLTSLGIESPSRVMADAAAFIPAGVAQGISANTDSAIQSIIVFASALMRAANDAFSTNGPIAGQNAVIGLANGARSSLQVAYDAGYETGEAYLKGYDDATDTHSPAREMMKRGLYAVQGLVNGLESKEKYLYQAGFGIGNKLTSAISNAMSNVAILANDDFAISPVITPVVDMSNVDSAASSVTGAFAGSSYSFSGEISSSVGRRLAQAERISANATAGSSVLNSNDNFTFNIYAAEGMDENAIADAVMQRMGNRFARRGVAYG